MEVAIGVAACAATPVIYKLARNSFTWKVNCWFCNENQRVAFALRNAWTCNKCEQYNGFTKEGDYNAKVPGMQTPLARKPARRYCSPPSVHNHGRPDVIPGSPTNVLCDDCNHKQEIIMEKIRNFEPINEDRWKAELDDYKYKLNKVYALCERCVVATQRKLNQDKKNYGHLNKIGSVVTSMTKSASRRVAESVRSLSRKHWFRGGAHTEAMHAISALFAFSLFLAHFNFLQTDADVLPSLQGLLPSTSLIVLNLLTSFSPYLSTLLLAIHLNSMMYNACRISFPDLLVIPVSCCLAFCSLLSDPEYKEDVALSQCVLSTLLTILTMAVWLLPRKKKHKNRPNTIKSAFSVASTPVSQCSSQLSSRNTSPTMNLLDASLHRIEKENGMRVHTNKDNRMDNLLWNGNESVLGGGNKENASPSRGTVPSVVSSVNTVSSRFQWREREQSPAPGKNMDQSGDMEWESTVVDSPLSVPLHMKQLNQLRGERREGTPSREIGGLLNGLKLDTNRASPLTSRGGPFGSLSFNPSVQKAYSEIGPTRSYSAVYTRDNQLNCAASQLSHFTSVSQRGPNPLAPPSYHRSNTLYSQDDNGSVLTSASQMEQPLSWIQLMMRGVIGMSVLSNAFLLYYVLGK